MKLAIKFVLASTVALMVAGTIAGDPQSKLYAAHALAPTALPRTYHVPCPHAQYPGSYAPAHAAAALYRAAPATFRGADERSYRITALADLKPSASSPLVSAIYHGVAARVCGSTVANRSWVISVVFPRLLPSTDLSYGIVFAARTPHGWRVWYRFH